MKSTVVWSSPARSVVWIRNCQTSRPSSANSIYLGSDVKRSVSSASIHSAASRAATHGPKWRSAQTTWVQTESGSAVHIAIHPAPCARSRLDPRAPSAGRLSSETGSVQTAGRQARQLTTFPWQHQHAAQKSWTFRRTQRGPHTSSCQKAVPLHEKMRNRAVDVRRCRI